VKERAMPATPHEILDPAGWKRARGYANGVAATGRVLYLGGTVGWDGQQEFTSDDFIDQTRQCLRNILDVLAVAGARPEHLVRMTWYITDRDEYLARREEIGIVYRDVIGTHFPAMAMVQVVSLMEARAKVEIEATAVLP
jgi:enamine deaminase RidA (YjgF/YER057c/UK114 family)